MTDCFYNFPKLCATLGRTDGRTDGRTGGPMEKVTYRGGCAPPKNGDIIVNFRDRPSQDLLYKNKEKKAKDQGFQEKNLIFIVQSLPLDTKKLLYDVREKCREIGIKNCH